MTYDTFVTFGVCLLHSIRKDFMIHTCWVLYGMAGLSPVDFVKAKQGSICMYFKYRLLPMDEIVGADGVKQLILHPVLRL